VSFAAPTSDGGSVILSYTVTSSVGGFTQTLTQATGGTFAFDNLQPATTYTFSIVATNAIGASVTATSNSVTTVALDVASMSSLTFVDDGMGTGGKLTWTGRNLDSVLYTGPANSYPGPYNYGTFTSGWNGKIRNLTPDTSYTISITAISVDGIGETKSLAFRTSEAPQAGVESANTTNAQSDSAKLSELLNWVDENVFTPGEAVRIARLLKNFSALETSKRLTYIKVPTSRVSKVEAISLTPNACSVSSTTATVDAGIVRALSAGTCTISYTVSDRSKAPVTMIRDFVFKKFAK
jgi:hypothetical protein